MKKHLLFLSILLFANISSASVWDDTQVWDESWEVKYSEWFANTVNETFFTQGEYGGIRTDCADAAYYTRAIFAYENKLPFEYTDQRSLKKINNKTTMFDHAPEGLPRLKALFRHIQDAVSTHSIHLDTYPVAITRDDIRPGIVVNHRSTGLFGTVTHHVDMVKEVKNNGEIIYISSTLPAEVRELTLSFSIKTQPEADKFHRQGFRSWYWPQNRGKPVYLNQGYSLEQYTARPSQAHFDGDTKVRTMSDFKDLLKERLRKGHSSRKDLEEQALIEVCTQFKARVKIIKSAEKFRLTIGNRCMNAQEYDNYSTPTRDERLRIITGTYLTNFVGQDQHGIAGSNNYDLESNKEKILGACESQEVFSGMTMSLYDFLKIMAKNPQAISSNPNVSIEARWGLKHESTNCPEY